MINLDKISNIAIDDKTSSAIQNITESNRLCASIRKKKCLWIFLASVLVILIAIAIIIPTVLLPKRKTTISTTTSTTTEIITTEKITTEEITTEKITTDEITTEKMRNSFSNFTITTNTKWKQDGITVAGGNGIGNQLNQLYLPESLYIDDDDNQTIYIADTKNRRIMKWKHNAMSGEIVGDDIEYGYGINKSVYIADFIIDKQTNSIIICDYINEEIVRWPLQKGENEEILITNIDCLRLTMDKNGYLYVVYHFEDQVKQWETTISNGIVVAGGNGRGDALNQLNLPDYIIVDDEQSIYVSDYGNHRVMKWIRDAKEGIIVAGGNNAGDSLTQFRGPSGIALDHLGNIYVVDEFNRRIMRWIKGAKTGSIIIDGNELGEGSIRMTMPMDLSFDRYGNLYVVDHGNSRIQKFLIDSY